MARMIPSFVHEDAPPGEKDVWQLLAAGPPTWTVMHSLDLAPWRKNSRTELDFVVVVPDAGVLCIEVKSQSAIELDQDGWRPASLGKGPFKQCQDAVKALHRRLRDSTTGFSAIPISGICVFPNAAFDHSSLAVADWELVDGPTFRSYESATAFCEALLHRLRRGLEAEGVHPLLTAIEPQRIDNLVAFCLPIRKRVPQRREEMIERERQLKQTLREPQKMTLQLCSDNPRVLITGGAGTGKTLIAMELALRASERHERVALVCFNQLVSEWVKTRLRLQSPSPSLIVDRAIRLLAGAADVTVPDNASPKFWNEQLPERVVDRLTSPAVCADAAIDYLILDEAQDILGRPWIWECLGMLLKGGVRDGRFAMFGDIEGQTLTGADATADSLESLVSDAKPARWRLTENCRNYDIVGKAAVSLSGMPRDTYSAYLRTGGSYKNLEYVPYADFADQVAKLQATLQTIRGRGYNDADITILSFCSPERSVVQVLIAQGFRMAPASSSTSWIAHSSVHAFKGMENKIIVVTDLDVESNPMSRALFYTALTRSTDSVYILCRQSDALGLINSIGRANQ